MEMEIQARFSFPANREAEEGEITMATMKCKSCEHEFEADANTAVCPNCGGNLTEENIRTTANQPTMQWNYAPQGQPLPNQPTMKGNTAPQGQPMPSQPTMQGNTVPQGQPMPSQPNMQGNYMPQGQPMQPNFCTGCGARLQPGMRFCTCCGRPIPVVPPKRPQTEDWAKKAENAVNEATDAVVDVGKKAWKKTKEFFQSL